MAFLVMMSSQGIRYKSYIKSHKSWTQIHKSKVKIHKS